MSRAPLHDRSVRADRPDVRGSNPADAVEVVALGQGIGPRPARATAKQARALGVPVVIADATQSRLEQAVTRLARISVLERIGARDALIARDDAQQRLNEIGIEATGWRRAFALAAGI